MPKVSIIPRELAGAHEDNSEEVIDLMAQKLVGFGVPQGHFTPGTYLNAGFTSKLLASNLKVFKSIEDVAHIEQVLALGVSHRYFDVVRACWPSAFYKFLQFLRGPAGQAELSKLAAQRRLMKRARDDFSTIDLGYQMMLEAQMADMKNALDRVEGHHQPIIEDLRRQLRMAEAACQNEREVTRRSFVPWCEWEDPAKSDFNKQCWEYYVQECRRKMKSIAPLTSPTCWRQSSSSETVSGSRMSKPF